MSASETSLFASQVKSGDALPDFSYDVTTTTVILGALATRDTRPMHHDKDFAINRNGTKDIFLNTPNQSTWFERYVSDWSGPRSRLGKMRFRMKDSVYPNDTMVFRGKVVEIEADDTGCHWATLEINLSVEEKTVTDCTVRVALPSDENDNPWQRKGERWKP
jgi:acyl dehydratase